MTRSAARRSVLIVTLAALAAWAAQDGSVLEPATIEAHVRAAGLLAPVTYVALYGLATVALVPGSLLSLAGGALFGPVWGVVWNLTGATLGAALAFLASRYVGGDWISRVAGGRLARLLEGVEAEGWRFVAFVRLVPLFPFNLLNYALGLTRIPFGQYAAASLVCMVPGAIVCTQLGYAGRQALAGSDQAMAAVTWALGLVAVLTLLPRLVRRFWRGPTAAALARPSGRPSTS
jgi:uncharacterized membrane protein YdjX (TVP38/TMEM64 family)